MICAFTPTKAAPIGAQFLNWADHPGHCDFIQKIPLSFRTKSNNFCQQIILREETDLHIKQQYIGQNLLVDYEPFSPLWFP